MLLKPPVAPAVRLVANDWKATYFPSGLSVAMLESLSVCAPAALSEQRTTSFVRRSLRKMSEKPFVSSVTRLVAIEWKATNLPSPLIDGRRESLSASVPAAEFEQRSIAC